MVRTFSANFFSFDNSGTSQMWVPGLRDIPIFLGLAVVYGVVRLLSRIPLRYIAEQRKRVNHKLDVNKFMNRTFDLAHYLASGSIGLVALSNRPYFRCVFFSWNAAEELAQQPCFALSALERVYFTLFVCYYICDIPFISTTREILMMSVHHVVTLSLITSVVLLGNPGVCMSIMLLHDLVDIPLYLGKFLLYMGFKKIKDVSLVFFVVMFFCLRLVNFPMIIYHCVRALDGELYLRRLWQVTVGFLFALLTLHAIWGWKIWTNVYGIVRGGQAVHDNRSDSD